MKKLFLIIVLLFVFVSSAWSGNDITGQTWSLDTVGAIRTTPFDIVWIIWTNIGTDADDLVINETDGGKLIVKVKGMAGIDMIIPFPGNSGHLPSFYLQTIDSGIVQVRIGKAY